MKNPMTLDSHIAVLAIAAEALELRARELLHEGREYVADIRLTHRSYERHLFGARVFFSTARIEMFLRSTNQRRPTIMNFSDALEAVRHGKLRAYRDGWNGKGMWIELQVPDANSKMSRPYIFMKTANDELVPWVASQSDLLADDWQLVTPENLAAA